jgi:predicted small lipoprotein YifL
MERKFSFPLILVALLALAGCGGPVIVESHQTQVKDQARSSLDSQLKSMTPAQRGEYFRAHPGDANLFLPNVHGAGPAPSTK